MLSDEDHLPLFRSPLIESQQTAYQGRSEEDSNEEEESLKEEKNQDALLENPQFHQHNEATNSELFYDLFFVANLTVFLDVHEVGAPVAKSLAILRTSRRQTSRWSTKLSITDSCKNGPSHITAYWSLTFTGRSTIAML